MIQQDSYSGLFDIVFAYLEAPNPLNDDAINSGEEISSHPGVPDMWGGYSINRRESLYIYLTPHPNP